MTETTTERRGSTGHQRRELRDRRRQAAAAGHQRSDDGHGGSNERASRPVIAAAYVCPGSGKRVDGNVAASREFRLVVQPPVTISDVTGVTIVVGYRDSAAWGDDLGGAGWWVCPARAVPGERSIDFSRRAGFIWPDQSAGGERPPRAWGCCF
jgi:hypothetical protein